jgi:hypothetical protein
MQPVPRRDLSGPGRRPQLSGEQRGFSDRPRRTLAKVGIMLLNAAPPTILTGKHKVEMRRAKVA